MDINSAIQALIASNEALRIENYQNTEIPFLEQGVEIFKTLQDLNSLMHSLKNPLGKREQPARVCRDLLQCDHKLHSGLYWIDPNLGCPSDTIQVICNFTAGGQTCLQPVRASKLDFGIGMVQMNFLHLLSLEAVQTITIHCLDFPVWADPSDSNPYARAMQFTGWNGQVFKANTLLQPKVTWDGCKVRDGTWRQTRFVFHTQVVSQLPIVELRPPPPTPQPTARYRVEVGPVCFL